MGSKAEKNYIRNQYQANIQYKHVNPLCQEQCDSGGEADEDGNGTSLPPRKAKCEIDGLLLEYAKTVEILASVRSLYFALRDWFKVNHCALK